jgi:hypothetical protein
MRYFFKYFYREKFDDELHFEFNMSALIVLLKNNAEQNPNASYFNVDILKYQVSIDAANHYFIRFTKLMKFLLRSNPSLVLHHVHSIWSHFGNAKVSRLTYGLIINTIVMLWNRLSLRSKVSITKEMHLLLEVPSYHKSVSQLPLTVE